MSERIQCVRVEHEGDGLLMCVETTASVATKCVDTSGCHAFHCVEE